MQHEAECESTPDGIPEPAQVPCRVRSRCGVGLDFNADYPAIAEFNEALRRYGKAKLKLKASIVENGNVAVDVTAAFVVSR